MTKRISCAEHGRTIECEDQPFMGNPVWMVADAESSGDRVGMVLSYDATVELMDFLHSRTGYVPGASKAVAFGEGVRSAFV